MELDFSSLDKAIGALGSALETAAAMARQFPEDRKLSETLRAGVVKTFEFTYELAWKHMRRWIEYNVGASVVDGVTRRELFRLAFESRLIEDLPCWMEFHEARNITSHTYQSDVAAEVAALAPKLLDESRRLLVRLREKRA